MYRFWKCSKEKLHFTPVHTLHQSKRDEALFPPLRRVVGFRARYGQKTAHRFGGWAKFGQRATHGWGKIALHTCTCTCLNQSATQWPCTPVAQCHFLHFRMLLFFGLTSYPAEIAYFNSPNGELSNGVRVMALYWSEIVDPSRSPCLKTVNRKSFERRNFLVFRPVLLKIAYFNSANGQLSNTVWPKDLQ